MRSRVPATSALDSASIASLMADWIASAADSRPATTSVTRLVEAVRSISADRAVQTTLPMTASSRIAGISSLWTSFRSENQRWSAMTYLFPRILSGPSGGFLPKATGGSGSRKSPARIIAIRLL